MTTTAQVINEIKKLRGAQVSVFGQPTTLATEADFDRFTIDIVDVLKALEDYEVESWEIPSYTTDEDGEEVEALEDIFEGIEDGEDAFFALEDAGEFMGEWKGDNSYNWSAPLSNDFDIKFAPASDGGEWLALSVHRFGDVRANYTNSILYHFPNEYAFYEAICEAQRFEVVEVEGVEYSVEVSPISDSYEVYTLDGGDYVCTAYGDEDDVIAKISEEVQA